MPFKDIREDLSKLARLWEGDQKSENRLIRDEKDLLIAWLWNMTHKNEAGHSSAVDEFVNASREAAGGEDWYDTLMRKRKNCSKCWETYRIENLSICPKCRSYYCYRCTPDCYCKQPLLG